MDAQTLIRDYLDAEIAQDDLQTLSDWLTEDEANRETFVRAGGCGGGTGRGAGSLLVVAAMGRMPTPLLSDKQPVNRMGCVWNRKKSKRLRVEL